MAQRKSTPSSRAASGKTTGKPGGPRRPVANSTVPKGGAGSTSTAKSSPSEASSEKMSSEQALSDKPSPESVAATNPPVGAATAARTSAADARAVKTGAAKASTARTSSGRPGIGKGAPSGKGPTGRKPAKSIVNQKQTPWGLILSTAVVVAFAVAVVAVVLVTHKSSSTPSGNGTGIHTVNANDPYRQPELPAAQAISGVNYRVEGSHTHVIGNITYDSSPPVGGDHSQYWADCTGTVYPRPIANENAVHMLEHGAIWITYNAKTLPAAQLHTLTKLVAGADYMALSPYPDLKTNISLQAWGYQLFVDNASDPRIQQFIAALRNNNKTTPEFGASCSQPTFKQHPSTFGQPLQGPATG